MGNGQQKNELTQTNIVVIIIVIIFCIVMSIIWGTRSNDKLSSKTPKIAIGSNVIIQSSGGNPVILGTTKESYKEMHKYSIANDQVGLSSLVLSGNAFIVESGTKALVIDRGVYEFEVRIQSGDRSGNSGWVADDLIKLAK